ncbi:MAG: zinc-binding dehydrogenase [Candidatus Rokuibacteriota bacterium]
MACSERFAAHLLEVVARGALEPVLDRTSPFERLADAHTYMLRDAQTGKIVLIVDDRA